MQIHYSIQLMPSKLNVNDSLKRLQLRMNLQINRIQTKIKERIIS